MLPAALPDGVTAQARTDGRTKYIFLMNFNETRQDVELNSTFTDLLTGTTAGPVVQLEGYGVVVLV